MACCSLQTPVAKAVRVDAGLENIAIKHCRVATGLQVGLDNPVEEAYSVGICVHFRESIL